MKKMIIPILLVTSSLMAEYVTVSSTSVTGTYDKESEKELYFGKLRNYSKFSTNLIKENGTLGAIEGVAASAQSFAKGFFSEGLKSAGTGFLIRALYAYLDPIIMDGRRDQKYVLLKSITMSDGKKAYKAVYFIGDREPSISEKKIHKIMEGK